MQVRVVRRNCSYLCDNLFLFLWHFGLSGGWAGDLLVAASQFFFPTLNTWRFPNPNWDSLTLPSNVTGTRSNSPRRKRVAACFIHEFLIWFERLVRQIYFYFFVELGEHHEELITPSRKGSRHVHVDVFHVRMFASMFVRYIYTCMCVPTCLV